MQVLTQAILELMGKPDHEVRNIGTRHGEKLYVALLSREEVAALIQEAIELHIEDLKAQGQQVPSPQSSGELVSIDA